MLFAANLGKYLVAETIASDPRSKGAQSVVKRG